LFIAYIQLALLIENLLVSFSLSPLYSITISTINFSFVGYGRDQAYMRMGSREESLMAFMSLLQSLLLGSFAAILAAHRSEILDKPGGAVMDMMDELHGLPPQQQQATAGRQRESDAPSGRS
jgi:hypothetical protein